MANCVYIIGNKTFNSEIELDDYPFLQNTDKTNP